MPMKVEARLIDNTSVVVAEFPPSKTLVNENPWVEGEEFERVFGVDSDDEYDDFEPEQDDFEDYIDEFEDDTDHFHHSGDEFEGDAGHFHPSGDDTLSFVGSVEAWSETDLDPFDDGELNTVIEWVAHTQKERGENCLPETEEIEGTLNLTEEQPKGEYLFRVRFFAPQRNLDLENPVVEKVKAKISEAQAGEDEPEIRAEGSWWLENELESEE
jgi:hypothetical protein